MNGWMNEWMKAIPSFCVRQMEEEEDNDNDDLECQGTTGVAIVSCLVRWIMKGSLVVILYDSHLYMYLQEFVVTLAETTFRQWLANQVFRGNPSNVVVPGICRANRKEETIAIITYQRGMIRIYWVSTIHPLRRIIYRNDDDSSTTLVSRIPYSSNIRCTTHY